MAMQFVNIETTRAHPGSPSHHLDVRAPEDFVDQSYSYPPEGGSKLGYAGPEKSFGCHVMSWQ